MSDIVEKTLASFPKFLSESLLGGNCKSSQNAPPRGFQNFIKMVSSIGSKYDEEQIVCREMQMLQKALSQPNISTPQQCDFLSRLVFCCMLGYDVSFCHIHAVKLAQKGTGINKRIGYMSVALLLHEDHEMIVLLINTIQKDLKSSNVLDNYVALTAASQLVNTESIPLILPLVLEKLKHPRELVRARAAQCLHRMFIRAPSLLQHHQSTIQVSLSDRDPSVISAVLHILSLLIQESPEKHLPLGESFIQILQQVINRTFPAVYEYHNIPLPWMQIQLLRILGLLGSVSESLSCQMQPLLSEVLRRNKVRENMAYAVLYECIIAITSMKQPHPDLLNEVSTCVARFLKSPSHNLRYLGIKALTALIGVDPVYATSHQLTVVECLDEEDEAIQRKTLMLLQGIANSANVQAICVKLLEQVNKSTDIYFKMETAHRIAQLVEKLSPDVRWYIETMHSVLLHVSDSPKIDQLTATVIKFIENSFEQFDETFQLYLLVKYLGCLQEKTTPTPVLKLAVWIIGKTSQNLKSEESSRVVSPMVDMLSRPDLDEELCTLVFSVLMTLVVREAVSTDDCSRLLNCDNLPLKAAYLKQKLKELRQLVKLSIKFPRLQTGHQVKTRDFTLSFLDDDVAMAIESGAAPYRPKTLRQQDVTNSRLSEAVYESVYQQISPAKSSSTQHGSVVLSDLSENSLNSDKTEHPSQSRSTGLNLSGVRRVWGQDGLISVDGLDADGDRITGSKSSTQGSDGDDKTKEKHQLAQALFEGVSTQQAAASSKKSWFTEDSVQLGSDDQSNLPKCDESKWRAIHQEHQSVSKQEDSLPSNQSAASAMSHDQMSANEISPELSSVHQDHHSFSYHDCLYVNQSVDVAVSHDEKNLLANEISSVLSVVNQGTNCQWEQGSDKTCDSERREVWVEGGASGVECTDSVKVRISETPSHINDSGDGLHSHHHSRQMQADSLLSDPSTALFSGLASQPSGEPENSSLSDPSTALFSGLASQPSGEPENSSLSDPSTALFSGLASQPSGEPENSSLSDPSTDLFSGLASKPSVEQSKLLIRYILTEKEKMVK
ncbi:AP-4 complex subunit epsilon-1-like [Gigantopelta aegis]|uniref:AP-4 complex subunit epsilon-1-like n=1 Tax=Gigantopelta aegis TaxID=1735272 RepID=UPI001B88D16C|nr:AP-4 complex subunit epsilon-1-like [Gigantopelta aegis]